MKKMLALTLFAAALSISAAAQDNTPRRGIDQMPGKNREANKKQKSEHGDASKENAPVELKTGEKITRGAALTNKAEKISLAEALKSPEKFADKTVAVSGVIVRSCKMEGCWMQLAPTAKDAESVRVTFGDHSFFIPLNAAGLNARAEGTFKVKTLSKAEVDHLVEEDGAKFDKRNADGSVTEVSFVANGVELTKN